MRKRFGGSGREKKRQNGGWPFKFRVEFGKKKGKDSLKRRDDCPVASAVYEKTMTSAKEKTQPVQGVGVESTAPI